MDDKIIRQVWQAKDAVSARHNNDVYALARHLRQSEKTNAVRMVDLHARRTRSPSSCVAESGEVYMKCDRSVQSGGKRHAAHKPAARRAGANEGITPTLNAQRSTLNAQVIDKIAP